MLKSKGEGDLIQKIITKDSQNWLLRDNQMRCPSIPLPIILFKVDSEF